MNEYICTSPAHAPITFLTVRGRVLSQTLTPPLLSFLALIKTFLKCWSTLIVMKYIHIFASQKHIFTTYTCTKEHFMSLLLIRVLPQQIVETCYVFNLLTAVLIVTDFNTCWLQFYRSITGNHFYNDQSDPNAQLISMLE